MKRDDLVVGHGSSRPLTAEEQSELARFHMKKAQAKKDGDERREKLKGYRFWCSEGCGFVDESHRCEQWSSITYVSPALYDAIKKENR